MNHIPRPPLPVHVRNVRRIIVVEAKRTDGSLFTDAFHCLQDARTALLERPWVSADVAIWTPGYEAPEMAFLVHRDEAKAWRRA
jgi:hypothetical protein